MKKTRIAIAGIGGVGGYIGGKLAHHYSTIENVEIVFIARGENYDVIREKGLELISGERVYACLPSLTTTNPLEIGEIDLFIICTKQFDVINVLKTYQSCLTPTSTIITTQNTVNGKETLIPYLPKGVTLMEGSIYIASNLLKPGTIVHLSGPAKLIFGTEGESGKDGAAIAKIFNDAGVDATYTTAINTVLWKKFMFVSPVAIVTSLFRISFAEIRQHLEAEHLYKQLIIELMQLAKAKQIETDEATVLNNLTLLANFKGNVKSSFQIDLEKNKRTEISALVSYVIEEGKYYKVETPNFNKALSQLTKEYDMLNT